MKKITVLFLLLAGMLLVFTQAYADVEFKFWADEDSYISKRDIWADSNYGDSTFLRVRDLDTTSYPDYVSRTLLKFSDADLAELSGWDIVSASLHLYEYDRSGSSTADEINLFRVTKDWAEDTVTWNNWALGEQPHANLRTAYRTFDTDDTTPGWRKWEGGLANIVQWWVTGAEDNFGLMLENDLDGLYGEMNVEFRSSDYLGGTSIYRPYLKITATPEPFSAVLFGIGAGFLGIVKVRRRKRKV
jgi:hypothetical protein